MYVAPIILKTVRITHACVCARVCARAPAHVAIYKELVSYYYFWVRNFDSHLPVGAQSC